MIFRRRRAGSNHEPVAADPTAHAQDSMAEAAEPDDIVKVQADAAAADTALLVKTVARHFEEPQIDGATVHIQSMGLSITCQVGSLSDTGSGTAAGLYFDLSGAAFGAYPVFASISGYGSSPPEAIVEGACLWCCSFGPALRSALTGADESDAFVLDAVVDGRPYQLHIGNLDRMMRSGDGPDIDSAEVLRGVRHRLGGDPLLTPVVLERMELPVLAPDAMSVLSVFVIDKPDDRTIEIKIGGRDWEPGFDAFTAPLDRELPGMALLRELAVLVPTGPAALLTRDRIERTLLGFDTATAQPTQAHGWPGWQSHGGRLDAPLAEDAVVAVEDLAGTLPSDYRHFLTEVAGSGAGPGYGLLTPTVHGEAILLAHGGCAAAWVMRLDGTHRGEIWVDAADSHGAYRRVASSFDQWYSAWLDAALRSGPWLQWDPLRCSTPAALVQLLEAGEPGGSDLSGRISAQGIVLTGSSSYLPTDGVLDPCHGCVALVSQFGLSADVFASGNPSPRKDTPPPN